MRLPHPKANSVFPGKRLLLVKSCVCGEGMFLDTQGSRGGPELPPSPKDGGKPTLNRLMLLQLLPNFASVFLCPLEEWGG